MLKKVLTYRSILISLALFFVFAEAAKAREKDNSRISVVVIDPGHGGKDPGANIGHAREKDIVLEIALNLGKTIKQNHPDIDVVYTRTKDVFIPLHKRADIANKKEADLFISIHANAVDAKSVQGTETFVLGLHQNEDNLEVAKKENSVILLENDYNTTYEGFDPNLPESYIMFETMQEEYQGQSIMLAANIQDEFRTHARRIDRSVKMGGFLVLRRTTMPSVLVETGFLSHWKERSYLLSKAGQNTLAQAIYRAFYSYMKAIEEKSTFNLVTEEVATVPQKKELERSPVESKQSTSHTPVLKKEDTEENAKPDVYFSVQIMALKKRLEPTPENFKGEPNVFRVEAPTINRYFSGKFETLAEANNEKQRIRGKYERAFVVAFQNNELISVKKAVENK